ncbi:MAG: IS3 family transposase [Thermoanaerobaculia bacterium]
MKKGRYTEEQIAYALRQAEHGTRAAEICRKLGISEQTFYTWKKRYAGTGVSELRPNRQLEDENRRLKQVVADLTLDKQMLLGGALAKHLKPAARREPVAFLRELHPDASQRQACEVVGIGLSSCRYVCHRRDDGPLRMRLRELAQARPRFGCRRLHILLRREGWLVNKKRTYRIYCEDELSVRTKKRKKRASHLRVLPTPPAAPNERWSMDFVVNCLDSGRRFRALTVVDLFTRECLAIEADVGLTGRKVARALDAIAVARGYPKMITVDNGSEFYSKDMDQWAFGHGVRLDFIRPGKPVENAFIESFNGRLRDEFPHGELFVNLDAARRRLLEWKRDYNEARPHSSLGDLSPARFAANWLSEESRKAES